jgi:hypothetical protein
MMTHQEAYDALAKLARLWVENWEETVTDLEEVGPETTDEELRAIVEENPEGVYDFDEIAFLRSVRSALAGQISDGLKVLAECASDWMETNARSEEPPFSRVTGAESDAELVALGQECGLEHVESYLDVLSEWRDAKRAIAYVNGSVEA